DCGRVPPSGGCAIGGRLVCPRKGCAAVDWACGRTDSVEVVTDLVSKANRLMSIRCSGDMLSEVTFPPQDPQPSVSDGGSAVEKPIAPWVEGVLTTTRAAGIRIPYRSAASRFRVWIEAVCPIPP